MAKKSILNKKSIQFLENYINNPSPTGFESEGQKMWLNYIKPYVDNHFVDNYGSVAAIINPKAKYMVGQLSTQELQEKKKPQNWITFS